MAVENGVWIMRGRDWNDPACIRTYQELIGRINEVGFLPLFKNEIDGFSVEEQTADLFWWTGDIERDPWEWRVLAARDAEVAYGKFFGGKAGFISLPWLPGFANYRRDGYDFDARWDDELASAREKKIMDCFERETEWTALQLKGEAGFGKGGEKNFSGVVTALQMETYLVIRDFRRKVNRRGQAYGMPVSVYMRPETVWGYGAVTAGYGEDPAASQKKIYEHVRRLFPAAGEELLRKVLR